MEQRDKWERDGNGKEWFWLKGTRVQQTRVPFIVHLLLQFTSVVVGCELNEKVVLKLHELEYCLNSTRASYEARVVREY